MCVHVCGRAGAWGYNREGIHLLFVLADFVRVSFVVTFPRCKIFGTAALEKPSTKGQGNSISQGAETRPRNPVSEVPRTGSRSRWGGFAYTASRPECPTTQCFFNVPIAALDYCRTRAHNATVARQCMVFLLYRVGRVCLCEGGAGGHGRGRSTGAV